MFEKALDQVSNSVERMERDYDDKLYDFHVAQSDGVTVGLALYYYRYSTWKGKRLYLEDIVITESRPRQRSGQNVVRCRNCYRQKHGLHRHDVAGTGLEYLRRGFLP